MAPEDVVCQFLERMQAREWRSAEALLHPNIHIEYTSTGEKFDGPAFLAMNEAYPEGWHLTVVELIASGNRVAAQVLLEMGDERDWCLGFYTVVNGLIVDGVEHWLTENAETPPEWRSAYSTPTGR